MIPSYSSRLECWDNSINILTIFIAESLISSFYLKSVVLHSSAYIPLNPRLSRWDNVDCRGLPSPMPIPRLIHQHKPFPDKQASSDMEPNLPRKKNQTINTTSSTQIIIPRLHSTGRRGSGIICFAQHTFRQYQKALVALSTRKPYSHPYRIPAQSKAPSPQPSIPLPVADGIALPDPIAPCRHPRDKIEGAIQIVLKIRQEPILPVRYADLDKKEQEKRRPVSVSFCA